MIELENRRLKRRCRALRLHFGTRPFTPQEAADALGIHPRTARKMLAQAVAAGMARRYRLSRGFPPKSAQFRIKDTP